MQQVNIPEQIADSVGLIVDRVRNPEQVIGQFCLTSKMRGVTAASAVFGYTEAPWALLVRFPHPDLTFGVKVVTLHPEFDKRQARLDYLAQANLGMGSQNVLENDIATVALDPNVQELQAGPAGELNNALSLPLSVSSQDISGNMTGPDLSQIIRKALASGREGLLTLFDDRNFPMARLHIRPGHIQKVDFRGLYGEMGLFELLYRCPAGTFVYQPPGNYVWPEVRDIQTPPETLGNEGTRRANELASMIESAGGKDLRYIRVQEVYNQGAISPSLQWVTERLWNALDGYITLDNLWQRIGADTYTIFTALQEMTNAGLISLSPASPFHMGGQLGTPLLPSQNVDISVGHPLSGFYIDPLSSRPVELSGSFVGVTRVQAPNQLLHTVPFPQQVTGGVIYSEGNILGINSGIFVPPAGKQVSQEQLYQMVFVGALQDMGTKRLRSAAAASMEAPDQEPVPSGRDTGPTDAYEDEYPEPEAKGRTLPEIPMIGGNNVNRKVVLLGAGALLLITVLIVMMSGQKKGPQPAKTPDATEKVAVDPLAKTKKLAQKSAGFKAKPLPTYEYVDTTDITKSQPSFGLESETQDQKMLFLIWPNPGPVDDLSLIAKSVPYVGVIPHPQAMKETVDQGTNYIGGKPFPWIFQRYVREEDKKVELLLVGAYNSPEPGKAVVVIARTYNPDDVLQHHTSLSVIDVMTAGMSKGLEGDEGGPGKSATKDVPVASPEEITAYVDGMVVPAITSRFRPPDISDEEEEVKAQVIFRIDDDGTVKKIEITDPSGNERYDKAVLKAVGSSYDKPPHTEDGYLTIQVTTTDAEITVKHQ